MRLEKLTIQGFKTFKNKQTIEFPYKFISITGPNGSGKSNIVEALSFVLGRSRGLRTDKLSEVIYNGGTDGKPADEAVVSAYFSTDDKKIVKITRIVRKDGKSKFLLEDKVVTKEKIIDMVGNNEYNILFQNDVTNFIEMDPKERRKIIDEICGISDYDEKKNNAIKELADVEEKISEANVKMNERLEILKTLEKEKEQAIKFKEIKKEISMLEMCNHYINLTEIEKKIVECEDKKLQLNKILQTYKISEESIKEKIKEITEKISSINKSIIELEKQHQDVSLSLLNSEQRNLRDLNKRYADLNERIRLVVKKKEELEKSIAITLEEIKKFSERINEIDKILKIYETKISSDIEKNVFDLKDKIYRKETEIDGKKKIYEYLDNKINEGIKKVEEYKKQISSLLTKEQEYARKIDDEMHKYKEIFERYSVAKKEKFEAEKEYEKLIEEYERIKEEYNRKEEILRNLKKNTLVDNLKKVVQGIYGTVSELCKISDPKYRKAFYSSAGNRLENIVVENEDVAIKCINILKTSKIGRATFLPINKINPHLQDEPPAGIGFIRNFLIYDKKFENVIRYIFRNTIVVQTPDDFKPLIGKYRMVSLDGDIAEKEGSLSGGFIKEALDFNEISDEIKEIEEKLKDIEEKIEKVRERKNVDVEDMNKKIFECSVEIEKLKIEKNTLSEKRKEIEKEMRENEERIKEMMEGKKRLLIEIENIEKELSVMKKNLEKIENEIKGEEYKKIEDLKKERHNIEIELTKKQKDKEFFSKQISELKIEELLNERKNYEDIIREKIEEIEKIKKEIKEREEENKNIEETIEKYEKEREELEKEIAKQNLEIEKILKEKERINNEINNINVERTRLEENKRILQENVKNIEEIKDFIEKNQLTKKEIMNKVDKLNTELNALGNVNLRAIESYDEAKKKYDEIFEKVNSLKNERQAIYDFIASVERKKRDVFMETYEKIKKSFEEIFKKLTDGYGTLTLDNPKDLSQSGLNIHVSLKGKKITNIDALSGGEKALTSVAFLLAIQQSSSSPFYVLDEVDASLDPENLMRLGKLLKETEGQFIVVTHNENMIKYADAAIGVSMQSGSSQIVGIKIV